MRCSKKRHCWAFVPSLMASAKKKERIRSLKCLKIQSQVWARFLSTNGLETQPNGIRANETEEIWICYSNDNGFFLYSRSFFKGEKTLISLVYKWTRIISYITLAESLESLLTGHNSIKFQPNLKNCMRFENFLKFSTTPAQPATKT